MRRRKAAQPEERHTDMGELLREIHPIKLGGEELMVELNEGGNASTGKIIHIQNKDFRLEMYEREFLRMAATVLRAKSELDYFKDKEKNKEYPVLKGGALSEKPDAADPLIKTLNAKNIPYRLVECKKGVMTLIVDLPKKQRLSKLCRGLKKRVHPYCVELGYVYLYKLTPFELYEKNGELYQIYRQLPCCSLTPKTFIPLDRMIQAEVWDTSAEKDGIVYLAEHVRYIYRLCRAVFQSRSFTEADVEELTAMEHVLDTERTKELMSKVFFNFTPFMIKMLKNKEFDEIISRYLSYVE